MTQHIGYWLLLLHRQYAVYSNRTIQLSDPERAPPPRSPCAALVVIVPIPIPEMADGREYISQLIILQLHAGWSTSTMHDVATAR